MCDVHLSSSSVSTHLYFTHAHTHYKNIICVKYDVQNLQSTKQYKTVKMHCLSDHINHRKQVLDSVVFPLMSKKPTGRNASKKQKERKKKQRPTRFYTPSLKHLKATQSNRKTSETWG